MKKFILITVFLLITPLNLAVSLLILFQISQARQSPTLAKTPPSSLSLKQSSHLYAALPQAIGEVQGVATASDARPIIIEKYLIKHKSPMAPYYLELLRAAEKYEVDPWLIIAIAQCETNLCKRSLPDSYNCWGFENGATKFLSWQQAFSQVAKTLKEKYLDLGLETPEEMMPKYAPPSVEKGGPWANCVEQFIEEISRGD